YVYYFLLLFFFFFFFFFQAEDGIRDYKVTGVQTCALPIFDYWVEWCGPCKMIAPALDDSAESYAGRLNVAKVNVDDNQALAARRSEERRVGKECRSRWWEYQ